MFIISMNWFIKGGGIMEKIAILCGDKGKRWSGWKIQHQYYHYIGSKKVQKTWWRKLLISWLLGWVLASMWIFWYMNSQVFEKRRETLGSMCDERARMLQDQFNVSMNHILALSILISTFHHGKHPSAIDQAMFQRFDRDRNGKIDLSEMREALRSLGYPVSEAVLDLLVVKFDKTGAGKMAIGFDGFIECCITVKGLSNKFKEKDQSVTGSATFSYEAFMMTVLPFIVA